MAFYATAKNGEISRVVPRLAEGTSVTTPRIDVQYLATEYGIVNLKQNSVRERALALISIAHPAFREGLLREAEKCFCSHQLYPHRRYQLLAFKSSDKMFLAI